MKFTKIPLNIKRFALWSEQDTLEGTNRIKVKNYHDSNGNIIYKKQLFTFDTINVSELVSALSEKRLRVYYSAKKTKIKSDITDTEEYDKYTKLNEDYNVFICLKITNLLYPHLRIAGE